MSSVTEEIMESNDHDHDHDHAMQLDADAMALDPPKVEVTTSASGNENFVVLDMAGDADDSGDDSDKDEREIKIEKQSKASLSDTEDTQAPKTPPPEVNVKPTSTKPKTMKTKPKAPVVDVNCLRKRKWQLKVYPLHTDDLQLNFHLCKLASESLLYIPSEGRHGKAELYVATQKDTATIIGKLLRMDFNHPVLSIEVVRKDTGGKEDGEDSKKECKAFLMFDRYLSKKIFDAKFEKGMPIEKIVTLSRLPKEATKDFIGALFPFATEVDVFESDDIDERKATIVCKTPVTALLVYKSFKRLEINDVHVKINVDDMVKAINLPPAFFNPPPEKKDLPMSGDPNAILNQSSLPNRRPLLPNTLNRRALLLKKKALITRRVGPPMGPLGGKPPLRIGPPLLQRPPRGLMPDEEMMVGPPMRRWPMDMPPRMRGADSRDFPGGPGRRRYDEKRSRDRDSSERSSRHRSQDRQVTKEMLHLQNQLNQAIKNQIAMLNTQQSGGPIRGTDSRDTFGGPPAMPPRTSLLGQAPRHFGSGATTSLGGPGPGASRGLMDHDIPKTSLLGQVPRHFGGASGMPRKRDQMEFGGNSWTGSDRSGSRMDRDRHDRDRSDTRPDRISRSDRLDRSVRDRSNDRDRMDRTRERGERTDRNSSGTAGDSSHPPRSHRLPQSYSSDSVRSAKGERTHTSSAALSTSHNKPDSARASSRRQTDFSTSSSSRPSGRTEAFTTTTSSSSNRYSGGGGGANDYGDQAEGGESSSYYRRY